MKYIRCYLSILITLFTFSCGDSNGDSMIKNGGDTIINGNEDNSYDSDLGNNTISNVLTGTENGKKYADLGLSVKWATCNVGAIAPEDYGDYFAWGETEPDTSSYTWEEYRHCIVVKIKEKEEVYMTKYYSHSNDGYKEFIDNKTALELIDDAAHVSWGGNWRMPTEGEIEELRNANNCTWTWTTLNGVNGYIVTSKKNSNSIFLPATGYRSGKSLYSNENYGIYWSNTRGNYCSKDAYCLDFNFESVDWNYVYRSEGISIRPVCP